MEGKLYLVCEASRVATRGERRTSGAQSRTFHVQAGYAVKKHLPCLPKKKGKMKVFVFPFETPTVYQTPTARALLLLPVSQATLMHGRTFLGSSRGMEENNP